MKIGVQVCHRSVVVNHSFLMILGSLKARAQRCSNAPKIIENYRASSELWPLKEHHVDGVPKSDSCVIYYRKSYCKKMIFLLERSFYLGSASPASESNSHRVVSPKRR